MLIQSKFWKKTEFALRTSLLSISSDFVVSFFLLCLIFWCAMLSLQIISTHTSAISVQSHFPQLSCPEPVRLVRCLTHRSDRSLASYTGWFCKNVTKTAWIGWKWSELAFLDPKWPKITCFDSKSAQNHVFRTKNDLKWPYFTPKYDILEKPPCIVLEKISSNFSIYLFHFLSHILMHTL